MIRKIFEKFKNIRFPPEKADVLIFDAMNAYLFEKYVLFNINYSVLDTRSGYFYISPKMILRILTTINLKEILRTRTLKGNLAKPYYLALFNCINPKVAITFIDNSPFFDRMSDLIDSVYFYAVQNGTRVINEFTDYEKTGLTSVQNFLCFGQNEIDIYRKSGSQIKNFHPVGSLKGSIYQYYLNQKLNTKKYGLCLVSQYRSSIIESDEYPEIKIGIEILNEYLSRFIKEMGLKACIATASESQNEFKYFHRFFGNQVDYYPFNREKFSTYEAMDCSDVIISFYSTAALEAVGWGKKVFLCNYSMKPEYSFTFSDVCTTDVIEYDVFKKKLIELINLSSEEYNDLTRSKQKYVMNYNPDYPVNLYLRELILDHIDEK